MNKKILLSFVLLSFILLSFILNQDKKSVVLAIGSSFACKNIVIVAGGCGNANGDTVWSSDGDTSHAKCYKDSDMGAVKCPSGYHVLAGGCRQKTSSSIQFSCPTNDPTTGASGDSVDETKVCLDYLNPGTYDWWVCNFAVNSNNETAIAICCAT